MGLNYQRLRVNLPASGWCMFPTARLAVYVYLNMLHVNM